MRLLPSRRLPLLVLLALAVALAALPGAGSVHAQSQTTVWSATLTVDKVDEYHGCDNEDTSQDNCSTNLTDDEFTYGASPIRLRVSITTPPRRVCGYDSSYP